MRRKPYGFPNAALIRKSDRQRSLNSGRGSVVSGAAQAAQLASPVGPLPIFSKVSCLVSNIIERAFELACESASLNELRAKLRGEGFGRTEVAVHLHGRFLKAQLNERMLPTENKRRVR